LRGNNEENALLAGAFDECRDNEKTCFRVSGYKLKVFICQIREETPNPLTIVSSLAAQLYGEFKEFFPSNAVEYFVS
jgi:excinuclease ABC subunit B